VQHVKQFLRLSAEDRQTLLQAAVSLLLIQLGLRCLSLGQVQQVVSRVLWRSTSAPPARRVAWAIDSAARRVRGSTCLARALAGQVLLAHYGYNARLRIGVRKSNGAHALQAHAWVTCDGETLIGGPEVTHYTTLLNSELGF